MDYSFNILLVIHLDPDNPGKISIFIEEVSTNSVTGTKGQLYTSFMGQFFNQYGDSLYHQVSWFLMERSPAPFGLEPCIWSAVLEE